MNKKENNELKGIEFMLKHGFSLPEIAREIKLTPTGLQKRYWSLRRKRLKQDLLELE